MTRLSISRWLAVATIAGSTWAIVPADTVAQDGGLPAPTPLNGPASLSSPILSDRGPAPLQSTRRLQPSSQLAGFRPIGSLTASGSIGTSLTGADVSDGDRPDRSALEVETIEIAASASYQNWTPISPIRSSAIHQPLYFEETNLERYGTSRFRRLQPLWSAAHFGATVATLPYQMAIQNPGRAYQYSHPFEAGRYGHHQRTMPSWDHRGGLAQAAVLLGLIFILP